MSAPNIIPQLNTLLAKPLQSAPERAPEHGGQLAALMPFKLETPQYAMDAKGQLIGLNLAGLSLDEASWAEIYALLPEGGATLRALNLSDNNLTTFDLSPLPRLERLNLSDNQLKKITMPPGLATRMTDLNLSNNPLKEIPLEIMVGGRKRVLDYFREKDIAGVEKSLEAKVVLVGEGMAGKTSLRTRLIHGEAAPLPEEDKRTRGLEVEVTPFYVDLPDGNRIRLNLFDFGGQNHYKPLHQFFYSHRALYVLVTRNGDPSANDFDYWFDTAQLFGGGSPVLVVNNLFGDVPSGFSRSRFARFENIIKDSLDTNLSTCKDFQAVKKRIGQVAEELPHVQQDIPKSWANVRRALEGLKQRNIIPEKEFLSICAREENGAMDKERALSCSAYLHDIGVCLHYQQFPALRRYVILRNEWATEAVYRVMDDPEVTRQHGHFKQQDLERIWQRRAEDQAQGEDFHYEDYLPELLELMRKFKLCYPLKKEEEFVAPSLLPVKQDADLSWQPNQDLHFEMEYDFMPPGLFSRFVVSRYEDIAGENRNHVWKDEVFFEWNKARACVRQPSRAGKQVIEFRVQSQDLEQRKVMLGSLLHDLEALHRETPGIKVEEKIPCICPRCNDAEDKQFFEHSVLKEFEREGDDAIQCQKSRKMVSVKLLLGNIFSAHEEGAPVDDTKRLIEKAIKAGDLEQALELLDHAGYKEAPAFLGEYRAARKSRDLEGANPEVFQQTSNRIRSAVLHLLK